MSQNDQSNSADNRYTGPPIDAGMQLDLLQPGGTEPSFLSAAFGNKVLTVLNALLRLRVEINEDAAADLETDNTYPYADVDMSNDGVVITLHLAPASSGGGTGDMVFKGDYNPATIYAQHHVVRVPPTNAAATTATPTPGGTIPGVYVYINATPSSGTPPRHPLSPGFPTGENAFWAWISTWPSRITGCDQQGNEVTQFVDQQNAA